MNGLGDDSALKSVCPRRCKNSTLKNKAAFSCQQNCFEVKRTKLWMHFCLLIFCQPTQRILIYGPPGEFFTPLQGRENPHGGKQSCTRIFHQNFSPEFFTRIFHQKFPRFAKYGSRSITGVTKQNIQSKMFLWYQSFSWWFEKYPFLFRDIIFGKVLQCSSGGGGAILYIGRLLFSAFSYK